MRGKGKILALAVMLLLSGAVFADTIDYTLNVSNGGIGAPGPWGTVTVNRADATHATVTFTTTPQSGFALYVIFDTNAMDLNVNGTAIINLTSFSNPFGNTPTVTGIDPGNVDGRGNFNYTVDLFDGPGRGVTTATLALVATGGTSWANAGSVLALNNLNYHVAAHIQPCTGTTLSTCLSNNATGFASDAPIPEPASILLFGSGLSGLAMLLRRRKL